MIVVTDENAPLGSSTLDFLTRAAAASRAATSVWEEIELPTVDGPWYVLADTGVNRLLIHAGTSQMLDETSGSLVPRSWVKACVMREVATREVAALDCEGTPHLPTARTPRRPELARVVGTPRAHMPGWWVEHVGRGRRACPLGQVLQIALGLTCPLAVRAPLRMALAAWEQSSGLMRYSCFALRGLELTNRGHPFKTDARRPRFGEDESFKRLRVANP